MARGRDKHEARLNALNLLGRHLARRSGSRCELCETAGVPLRPHEVGPPPEEPDLERTIFVCDPCGSAVDGKGVGDAGRWRFLEGVVWSDVPVVQVAAVRITRRLADSGVAWAVALSSSVYVADDVAEWVDAG